MTALNEGRNEIRFGNSSGRCLLENWVEERAVAEIEPSAKIDPDGEIKSHAQLFKDGHQSLLTTNKDFEKLSTVQASYQRPTAPQVRTKGKKEEIVLKMLYNKFSKEVQEEFNPPPEPTEFRTVTMKDFNIESFTPTKPAPTAAHDYVSEQPVTFWTEHRDKMHGISQLKTLDTPFRKNTSFSKPIEEYWDQPQPYEQEVVPKM